MFGNVAVDEEPVSRHYVNTGMEMSIIMFYSKTIQQFDCQY